MQYRKGYARTISRITSASPLSMLVNRRHIMIRRFGRHLKDHRLCCASPYKFRMRRKDRSTHAWGSRPTANGANRRQRIVDHTARSTWPPDIVRSGRICCMRSPARPSGRRCRRAWEDRISRSSISAVPRPCSINAYQAAAFRTKRPSARCCRATAVRRPDLSQLTVRRE